jgi:hypothetical protein
MDFKKSLSYEAKMNFMERKEIIKKLNYYFSIKELVCPHTFAAFGETSWQFLDLYLLETILVVRRNILQVEMYVNTTQFPQRGFRCNICQIPKDKTLKNQIYLSAHCNGAAIDFDEKGYTAEQTRQTIILNKNLLPHRIRLEKAVNWVHMDIYDDINSNDKVTLF